MDWVIHLKQAWPQIYSRIEYDGGVRGISGEILNYFCALQWVFIDIFIIAISICLSTRLYQLNKHMKQYTGIVNVKAINMHMCYLESFRYFHFFL